MSPVDFAGTDEAGEGRRRELINRQLARRRLASVDVTGGRLEERR
jgi:hypothetical protein